MDTELYEFIYDSELKTARMQLPLYYIGLPAHECVAELKSRIEKLNKELRRHQRAFMGDNVDVPKSLEKMRRVILEIELAKHYYARARERYDEGPWASDMVNRLPSAA